ncbi:hypothetical protein DO73_3775 [Burkholderia pseudomallei]|nr:hypothetical protein DO73_3775 [Burkholderia pseudomallei]
MHDGPDHAVAEHAHPDARVAQRGEKRLVARLGDVEEHHVRLDHRRAQRDARNPRQLRGEARRAAVIVREPRDHRAQRDEPGGRHDAGLPRAAAEQLPIALHAIDQGGAAAHHRAVRRGEALRQAELDRIDVRDDLGRRRAEARLRVEQTRAVHVHGEPVLVGERAHAPQVVERQHAAAGEAMRILERDHRGGRALGVALVADRRAQPLERQAAVVGGLDGVQHRAADERHAARLVVVQVGAIAEDHLVPARALREQRAQVAERAARDERRRFLAGQSGRHRFELVDRRILAIAIVAHIRGKHRVPHLRGRQRHRVAQEINHRIDPLVGSSGLAAPVRRRDGRLRGRLHACHCMRAPRIARGRAAASGRRRREQIGDAPAPPRVRRVPRGAAPPQAFGRLPQQRARAREPRARRAGPAAVGEPRGRFVDRCARLPHERVERRGRVLVRVERLRDQRADLPMRGVKADVRLPHQRVGDLRRAHEPRLGRRAHLRRIARHAAHHQPQQIAAFAERLHGVRARREHLGADLDRIAERRALRREHRRVQRARDVRELAFDDLQQVWVLLLRHQRRAAAQFVRQREEVGLAHRPELQVVREPAERRRCDRDRGQEMQHEIAARDRVERAVEAAREAEQRRAHARADREIGARARARAERTDGELLVEPFERRLVAPQRGLDRPQVIAEAAGLRRLVLAVRGQRPVERVLRLVDDRRAHAPQLAAARVEPLACAQLRDARVDVVARARRMHRAPRVDPDPFDEQLLVQCVGAARRDRVGDRGEFRVALPREFREHRRGPRPVADSRVDEHQQVRLVDRRERVEFGEPLGARRRLAHDRERLRMQRAAQPAGACALARRAGVADRDRHAAIDVLERVRERVRIGRGRDDERETVAEVAGRLDALAKLLERHEARAHPRKALVGLERQRPQLAAARGQHEADRRVAAAARAQVRRRARVQVDHRAEHVDARRPFDRLRDHAARETRIDLDHDDLAVAHAAFDMGGPEAVAHRVERAQRLGHDRIALRGRDRRRKIVAGFDEVRQRPEVLARHSEHRMAVLRAEPDDFDRKFRPVDERLHEHLPRERDAALVAARVEHALAVREHLGRRPHEPHADAAGAERRLQHARIRGAVRQVAQLRALGHDLGVGHADARVAQAAVQPALVAAGADRLRIRRGQAQARGHRRGGFDVVLGRREDPGDARIRRKRIGDPLRIGRVGDERHDHLFLQERIELRPARDEQHVEAAQQRFLQAEPAGAGGVAFDEYEGLHDECGRQRKIGTRCVVRGVMRRARAGRRGSARARCLPDAGGRSPARTCGAPIRRTPTGRTRRSGSPPARERRPARRARRRTLARAAMRRRRPCRRSGALRRAR